MPTKLSAKEVLAYLNQLGYNNISADQLKEFIYDLKKLIKHDERQKLKAQQTDEPSRDVFEDLYEQGTVESKAKAVPKKESVISVKIKKSHLLHNCLKHNKENIPLVEPTISQQSQTDKNETDGEIVKEVKPSESRAASSKTTKSYKAKASFIRPYVKAKGKSDPVALYHQYQAEWKRHKLPGEDNRTELRWAIREKMMGRPR